MSNAHTNNTNPTDKESSEGLRIAALEGKMITVQNQLTHTVTKADLAATKVDLQKTIATLATKDELRDGLRELKNSTEASIRGLKNSTEASIRELKNSIEKTNLRMDEMRRDISRELRESIHDLRSDMWKAIGAIAAVVVAIATVVTLIVTLIIKVF